MIAADRVAVILLAAGQSRRFGDADKLLADLDGRPLVSLAAERLAGMGFATLIGVCSDARVAEVLTAARFETLHNPAPAKGLAGSIAIGVEAAMLRSIDAVLLCLADMPRVGQGHLTALLAAFDPEGAAIAASTNGTAAMPPAIFGRQWFAALAMLQGDQGARALLGEGVLVRASMGELTDIDRPEDLAGG